MELCDDELWEHIKEKLIKGTIVYPPKIKRRNEILSVDGDEVHIKDRHTKPRREDIFCVYQYVHRVGRVTREDLYGEGSILGHPYARKTGRIIMGILANAVRDEIETIPGLSGIRLRSQ